MTGKQLKNSILQLAIQGKLVPQDPHDEPASELLKRIRKEKEQLVKTGKLKKKDLESTPIAEDEKPFEIPESWEWCRLGEICSRFSTGPFGSNVHKEDYVIGDGVPMINPTNIKNGIIDTSEIKFVNKVKAIELGTYFLCFGDIVLARRGDLSKCAVITEKEEGYLAGTGAFFLHILKLYLPYFEMLYASPYVQSYLLSESRGDTMNNLNQKLLGDMVFPLPPLSEQHRIVEKIEELMPLVEEYDKAQSELDKLNESLPEQLKKSILQQAIMGKLVPQDPNDEPASELLKRIHKEKENLVKSGALKKKDLVTTPISDDEKPFEIPESWEWCRLGEISTYSATKRKINAKNASSTLWGLDLEDIEKGGNLICRKSVGERNAIGDKTLFNKGDILYSKLRPYLLKILVAPEDGICTPEIVPFSCYCSINHNFVVKVLMSSYVDEYINRVC